MGLTPRKSGGQCVKPDPIAVSALAKSLSCPAGSAPGGAGGTVSVWFKPAGTPGSVLADQTRWHHVHMRGTAAAMDVTLNGAFHGTLNVAGATSYAEVLGKVLTRCAGSAKGYLARLIVLHDQLLGPGWFGRTVNGQWVSKRVGMARNFAPDPDFSRQEDGGWTLQRGPFFSEGGVDFCDSEKWAVVHVVNPAAFKKVGRRLLICSTVTSQSTGSLRVFTYPNNLDGSQSENLGRAITAPGHYRDVVFTDAESINAGIQVIGYPCDALLARLDIVDMDSGPAFASGSARLVFEDAVALGLDDSGNSCHWTLDGAEQTLDTPTNNLCVLNPADKGAALSLSSGNRAATGSGWDSVRGSASLPPGGRVYWETASAGSRHIYGIATAGATLDNYPGSDGFGYGIKPHSSTLYHNGLNEKFTVPGYTLGSTVGFLWDGPSGSLNVVYDNTVVGTLAQGVTGTWYPAHSCKSSSVACYNFGATPFAYDLPQGAVPLTRT